MGTVAYPKSTLTAALFALTVGCGDKTVPLDACEDQASCGAVAQLAKGFYALAEKVYHSTDGNAWQEVNLQPSSQFIAIVKGNDELAVFDADGSVFSSLNGTSWQALAGIPSSAPTVSAAFDGSSFIAATFSYETGTELWRSSETGAWDRLPNPEGVRGGSINCFSDGVCIMRSGHIGDLPYEYFHRISGDSVDEITSDDSQLNTSKIVKLLNPEAERLEFVTGDVWLSSPPEYPSLWRIQRAGDRYLALGQRLFATSSDTSSWTEIDNLPIDEQFYTLYASAASAERTIAVGNDGSRDQNGIAIANSGTNNLWTSISIGDGKGLSDIIFVH